MSVFDKLIHQKDAYDKESLKMLGEFIQQLDSRSGKEDPDKASRDLKYVRSLQRARLKRKNVVIKARYDLTSQSFNFVSWKFDTDNRYKVRIPFYELNTETDFLSNNKIRRTVKEKQNIFAYAVWLRGQRKNASYCCRNCGAVSTIEELLSGCSYCGTKFLMTDLYPKISSIYTQKELDIDKHFKSVVAVVTVFMTALTFILNYRDLMALFSGTYTGSDKTELILGIPIAIGAAIFLGVLLANLSLAFRKFEKMIVTSGLRRRTIKSGRILSEFMKKYEPSFSMDYFITKIVYFAQVMTYTENYENCALYAGQPMTNQWQDVIDARYRGFVDVHACYQQNGFIYVDVSISMNNIRLNGNSIKRKNETIRMLLRKSATAETDYGFSIHSINCRSCGGSFDAAKEKHCPYCGNDYVIDSYDWVVMDFKID